MTSRTPLRLPAPANLLVFEAWTDIIARIIGLLSALVGLVDDILSLGNDED